jgi:thiol:disulfide interchange protein DsbA
MAKKKTNNVLMARNTIIGFVTLVGVAILGFGTYVSTGLGTPTKVTEDDYRVVENARPRRSDDPIEVIEFFSYGCIHCKTFDPIVDDWAAEQAEDVVFSRQPTTFSPIWALLAQSYLTLEAADALEENHSRIFRAIHDARRQFLTPEMVADYVDGRGLTSADFMREFNSPKVRDAMREADRDQRLYQIAATPSLVVAGKYVVGMEGGQKRALRVIDELIALERGAGL